MPAVPTAHLQPEALKARFAQPPAWEPEVVRESFTSDRPPAQAAVLMPIVMRGPQASLPTVLLTRRAAHIKKAFTKINNPKYVYSCKHIIMKEQKGII